MQPVALITCAAPRAPQSNACARAHASGHNRRGRRADARASWFGGQHGHVHNAAHMHRAAGPASVSQGGIGPPPRASTAHSMETLMHARGWAAQSIVPTPFTGPGCDNACMPADPPAFAAACCCCTWGPSLPHAACHAACQSQRQTVAHAIPHAAARRRAHISSSRVCTHHQFTTFGKARGRFTDALPAWVRARAHKHIVVQKCCANRSGQDSRFPQGRPHLEPGPLPWPVWRNERGPVLSGSGRQHGSKIETGMRDTQATISESQRVARARRPLGTSGWTTLG